MRGHSAEVVRRALVPAVVISALVWSLVLFLAPDAHFAQTLSNVGLTVVALAAGVAGLVRAHRGTSLTSFWWLFGLASLSWSLGQATWTWYESVLGQEVPFPSLADVGYLGMPPLAGAALLGLPLAAPTLAGRVRTILDGLMVASSLLLVSWIVVLGPVLAAGGDSPLAQSISLAYPIGDTVLITVVMYTWLRARHSRGTLPLSLPLVGSGLVAFAVADSGFAYLTTLGSYTSGSLIDAGWFAGFALMTLAALRSAPDVSTAPVLGPGQQMLGTFLPYTAVTVALVASALDLVREGMTDSFISWNRSALLAFLVARQVLTLRENLLLTRDLEHRVDRRTAELHASRERFAALAQHSSDVVTVLDGAGTVTYQSESSDRVLARPAVEMTGLPVWDFLAADQAILLRDALTQTSSEHKRMQTVYMMWQRADGEPCHLEVTITNLLETAGVNGFVLNSRDVTDRTVLEEQLLHQAFHDSLTSLANRAMFKNRLEHAISRRNLPDGSLVVLFLDLDGFKEVNDSLGHSSGDLLLVQVAERLRAAVRPGDTVARFGGDEFAVLVDDLVDPVEAATLAARITTVLAEPYQIGPTVVHLSASVGIAYFGEHATDAEQLLRNADLAMYQAKEHDTGGYAPYDPRMHAGLVERVRLGSELRRAVEDERLLLHYQPLIEMRTGRITGVEALVRWPHPERGLVPPTEFIPLAESMGLIKQLGAWVLREACQQAASWQQRGREPFKVSVNVSAHQLHDGSLIAVVDEALQESGLDARQLTLEMTESVLLDDSNETLATLRILRQRGVRLAIDDFGTGYSSLSYLHRFPIDVLKIDRSFIERLSHGGDTALVSTIVRLGHSMNLETVAEGIERPDEMLMLRRQGCTTGQGYHFSPPVPADELGLLLEEQAGVLVFPTEQTSTPA